MHLRILLGVRIGFRRNNHHKCLVSQIQLILQADILFTSCTSWADSPQQGGTSSVFVSKLSCREAPGAGLSWHWPELKSTHGKPVPWKLPAVFPQGPTVGLSQTTVTQPGSAQRGNNSCHEISSNSEHIAVQLWDSGRNSVPHWTAQRNGSQNQSPAKRFPFLCNSRQANILRSGKTKLFMSRGNQLLPINVSFCIESSACWHETIPDILKNGSIEKNYIPLLAMCWSILNHIYLRVKNVLFVSFIYHIKILWGMFMAKNSFIINKWKIFIILEMELSSTLRYQSTFFTCWHLFLRLEIKMLKIESIDILEGYIQKAR